MVYMILHYLQDLFLIWQGKIITAGQQCLTHFQPVIFHSCDNICITDFIKFVQKLHILKENIAIIQTQSLLSKHTFYTGAQASESLKVTRERACNSPTACTDGMVNLPVQAVYAWELHMSMNYVSESMDQIMSLYSRLNCYAWRNKYHWTFSKVSWRPIKLLHTILNVLRDQILVCFEWDVVYVIL